MNTLLTTSHATGSVARAQVPQEFLSFRIGGEEYGIDILSVQEIRGFEQPTRMVGAPAHVLGVRNLRGIMVPIIDLRMKLAMAEARYDELTVTVILNVGQRVLGVVVDAVNDVLELTSEQIKPAPQFRGYVDAESVTGIASLEHGESERMVILLDIARLMTRDTEGLAQQTVQ